ncbi:response regulator [Pseudoalteromonas rubra]|uniref:Response regulator n=1 Tax=Pseudoalteromonas rubra TaxID=43658 RepID=A0A5S3UUB3_9GAMM|nr:winged helix-turn-helix domain-containing protein [Pseudoalteromonas rubra]QPB84472.1 response regulator [Pseudoalteromonas rubra]
MTTIPNTHLLLIEDDHELAHWICDYLTEKSFTVSLCHRGDEAPQQILSLNPDLVILDGMLPGLDGLDVCKQVRPQYCGPILMLTARDEDMDEVLGLEMGADDYLTKPVRARVLLARIRALLRRHNPTSVEPDPPGNTERIEIQGLLVDKSARTVTLQGETIDVSSKEFDLLWLLAKSAGELVTRDFLTQSLRGFEYDGFDRSIDLRISRLRKKLGDNPVAPFRIKTVWGQGYQLVREAW